MTVDYTGDEAEADEPTTASGYRSYEVYQRERVGETTNLVNPRDLITPGYLDDPFTIPSVVRENYRCYRDWVSNRFWLTRYDDVTSVFVDDANFVTRPVGSAYGADLGGADLSCDAQVHKSWVELHDLALERCIDAVLDELDRSADIATDVADQVRTVLLTQVIGAGDDTAELIRLRDIARVGTGWDERARIAGMAAFHDLCRLLSARLARRQEDPASDLISVLAAQRATADDAARTLLEMDLETLPASISNLWCLMLTHPEQFAAVKREPRLMKFAYLEALRHSPPIATTNRFARHEVERFGRLLPQGALLHLSAAAANRDPRQFANPDTFDVTRKDLCRREPRGQYRSDGLPAGITFGHGKPSRLPAVPRDEPRSRYALTRDIAVAVSLALLSRYPNIHLAAATSPSMSLDRLGGTYRCRNLIASLA